MSSTTNPSTPPTFETLYAHLLTHPPPLLPPTKPHSPPLTATISSLSLHPTLEVALHILNADLPSAHFLVRHMPGPPAHEGMYLHALLHRIEGDYANALAWYGNVSASAVFEEIWGQRQGWEGVREFVGRVERLRKEGVGERGELEGESRREVRGVVEWCVRRFGTGEVRDARGAWSRPSERDREVGREMVVGGEGWRKF